MGAAANGGAAATGEARRLTVEEARFYATVYAPARKGCLGELCRRGCAEEEAEELFAAAFEKVMESVDPIERSFSAPEMVAFIKRAAWRCLLDERYHRGLRPEVDLEGHSLADPSAESPEEAAEEREAVAMALDALAALSERDRQIFCQRHQLERTPQEIVEGTPGLTRRTYRKIIERANARAFAAFERIEGGERCEEMADPLRRYVAEESPQPERLAVEAHLAHCRACRRAAARMRGFLLDVASGLAVGSSALASHRLARLSWHLLQAPSDAARGLLEAARAARERLREVALRAVGALPGGGESTVGPALTSTSAKVASVCAMSVAAGACVAAGVVPGIGGLVSLGHRGGEPDRGRVERPSLRSYAPVGPQAAATPTAPTTASPSRGAGSKQTRSTGSHRQEEHDAVAPAARQTSEPQHPPAESAASVPESPTVTGDEFGAESGQPVQTPATSAPSVSSGSARPSGSSGGGETESRSSSQGKGSSEFGF